MRTPFFYTEHGLAAMKPSVAPFREVLPTNRGRPTLAVPIDPALRRSYDSQKWPHRLNP